MVTSETAKCEDKKWFDKRRCKGFKTCDDPPCDLKDLPYTHEAIDAQLKKERQGVMKLMLEKKRAKKDGDKKKFREMEQEMIDKTIGVMIMQDALVRDFALKMRMSDRLRAMREIRRWKKQLK
ncbi:hypothetical protein KAX97_14395 [candidate division WOR-3 bacterium]|nr:hypothetical protein [candidate division WOR-3 bacterium]